MHSKYKKSEEPTYTGAGGVYPYSKAIERKFTFTSRFDEEVSMCALKGDNIIVPRQCCPLGDDRRSTGGYVEFGPMVLGPRNDEQQRLYDESLRLLKAVKSHILQAATGVGKTFLGVRLAQS